MLSSRKYLLALIGIGAVLIIAIGTALLKKVNVDIGSTANWAIGAVTSLVAAAVQAIASEDKEKARTEAAIAQANATTTTPQAASPE